MYKSQVKTLVRRAEQTILSGTPDEEAVRAAITRLDKAAVKGVIHKNNAARRKSRLMKKFNLSLQGR
jgi:small subunit ribosomal protein S20